MALSLSCWALGQITQIIRLCVDENLLKTEMLKTLDPNIFFMGKVCAKRKLIDEWKLGVHSF